MAQLAEATVSRDGAVHADRVIGTLDSGYCVAPGTQLIVRRTGYRHHGIYVGYGRVIHYVRRTRYPEGLIEEVSIVEFSRGSAVRVGRQPDGASRGQNIVLRARSRLGERRYDVVRNNCEHFCNWCQSGEHRSSQIDLLPRPVRLLLDVLQRVRVQRGFVGSQ
jgi:hypothetical protein